jgi:hypothetical protein
VRREGQELAGPEKRKAGEARGARARRTETGASRRAASRARWSQIGRLANVTDCRDRKS